MFEVAKGVEGMWCWCGELDGNIPNKLPPNHWFAVENVKISMPFLYHQFTKKNTCRFIPFKIPFKKIKHSNINQPTACLCTTVTWLVFLCSIKPSYIHQTKNRHLISTFQNQPFQNNELRILNTHIHIPRHHELCLPYPNRINK